MIVSRSFPRVLLFLLIISARAFHPTLVLHQDSRYSSRTTTSLFSSTNNDSSDNSSSSSLDDDEISKLIGKRSQIKRKKMQEPPPPPNNEPIVDLDLDKLPEFKTERPVRRQKAAKSETDDDEQQQTSKKQDSPIVDFKADHDDENELHIPNRMGVTTMAWGDPNRDFVASGKLTKRMLKAGKFVPGDLQLAYNQLLEGGITFIETAPTHGAASRSVSLTAEDILGRCLAEQPSDLPESMVLEGLGSGSPWRKALTNRGSLSNAMVNGLEESLNRLGTSLVEVYQVPKSFLLPSRFLCKALAAVIESGQCNYVGVQGVTRASTLRKIQRKLDSLGTTLTTNAFEFSLTNTKHEFMIDICKEFNVIPLITNPLDGGLASGVYTATNPSGGQAVSSGGDKFTFKQLEKLQPLHSVQETVAERVRTRVIREMRDTQERFKSRYGPPPKINTDITTTQVALNYVIAKGGVPLTPVNNPIQAKEVLGCLGWSLTDGEVDMLDAAAALCRL